MRQASEVSLKQLTWTKELASSFWNDLAGISVLAEIAFAKFAAGPLVDIVQPYLRKSDIVLDYGGGDNLYLVRELLGRGYEVGCVEPNSEIERRNSDLIQFTNFRGAVRELERGTYDCVFFSEVIEHLDDADCEKAMLAISDCLKPGGLLVVTTPDNEDLVLASRYCPRCRHLFHPWGHIKSFTAGGLERVLAEHGFSCEELHSVDFSNARELVERARRDAKVAANASVQLQAFFRQFASGSPTRRTPH